MVWVCGGCERGVGAGNNVLVLVAGLSRARVVDGGLCWCLIRVACRVMGQREVDVSSSEANYVCTMEGEQEVEARDRIKHRLHMRG